MSLTRPVFVLALSLALGACAVIKPSQPDPTEHAAEPQPAQQTSEPALESAPNETPIGTGVDTGLTESLLYELLVANLALNAQDFELAGDSMSRAANESQDIILIENAARFSLHAKQYAQALEHGKAWVALDADNYLAYLISSVAAVLAGQDEQAFDLLSKLVELDPEDYSSAYRRIGEIYLQHPAGLESYDVIKPLVLQHPEIIQAWVLLAALAQRDGKLDELSTAIDKILQLDPQNERAAILKLTTLQDGEMTPLTKFAKAFTLKNPQAEAFKMAYGRTLLRKDQPQLALQEFLALLQDAPNNAQALNLTALVYHQLEDYAQSAEYFSRHLKVRPQDNQSRIYLASALYQLERFDEANAAVMQINEPEERFNSSRQIAMQIEQTSGVQAGMDYLRSIDATTETQQARLIADQANMLQRADQLQDAAELLTANIPLYPDEGSLRYQRALLYVELKQLQEHERDMRILLEQEPENAHYYNTLGYSLLIDGVDRLSDAAELINRAHQLAPQDPYILDSKGWLEFKLGNKDKALVYLNQAFALDPDPEIAAHLGEVHWHLGRQDEAKAIWQKAFDADDSNASLNAVIKRFMP